MVEDKSLTSIDHYNQFYADTGLAFRPLYLSTDVHMYGSGTLVGLKMYLDCPVPSSSAQMSMLVHCTTFNLIRLISLIFEHLMSNTNNVVSVEFLTPDLLKIGRN